MTTDKNPLINFFNNKDHNLINKWIHYFDIYHEYFKKFRKKNVVVLEFGISHGGSLQMWKHYFGKRARIIGVDINPECKKLKEPQVEIYIGSQEDRKFIKSLMKKIGDVDIVIDDGGHTMSQQITTFEETYRFVREGGIYLTEDLHTSYWGEFGGGLRKQGTFIEYAKMQIDQLHAWYSKDNGSLAVNDFTRTTHSIHFYDSIVIFKKGVVKQPTFKQIGKPQLSEFDDSNYESTDY